MTILIYDSCWFGLLSAVFEVYERKIGTCSIITAKHHHPDVFGESLTIVTDPAKALRVWTGLKKRLPANSVSSIYACYLSEMHGIENTLLQFIRLAFSIDKAEQNFAHPAVLKTTQVAKMVYREKHRMEAFVRFRLTHDDIYYSGIEPDFNVLPLIALHFKKRYADQKWLIYDLKRKYGIFYDLESVQEISLELNADISHSTSANRFKEDEMLYQTLWKDYFNAVTITERLNTRLHIQHVPKRYWKYLTEKSL